MTRTVNEEIESYTLAADTSLNLYDEVNKLLRGLSSGAENEYGFGAMSSCIYDTSWVALVPLYPGNSDWLFPEAFSYVLEQQQDNGGWHHCASDFDDILNSSAALYAIVKHLKNISDKNSPHAKDLESRVHRATAFLDSKLSTWNISSTQHVGFEVIVPAMLRYLAAEGINFEFPGRRELEQLETEKLSRFHPSILAKFRTTALHSLEAFIGKVDFDTLRHCTKFGSMMASPASTAAYLMNITERDNEAEEYLRFVVGRGRKSGAYGSVPSAFPSTYFEYSWVVSTLLEGGFEKAKLDSDALRKIFSTLEIGLNEGSGLLGFAPSVLPDADDTAKGLLALSLLGAEYLPDSLIAEFEAETHFRTYAMERNPSLSANCNVLATLLGSKNVGRYTVQIEKCVRMICATWWSADTPIHDKWNLSWQYSCLLLSQGLIHLLVLSSAGLLPSFPKELLEYTVPIVLTEALSRTLVAQEENGSWENKAEVTAYAVLALAHLSSLPWVTSLQKEIELSIHSGRTYIQKALQSPAAASNNCLWIEKVSYSSPVLTTSYCLAALNTPVPAFSPGTIDLQLVTVPFDRASRFTKFWARLPMFKNMSEWKIRAGIIEGYIFLPQLQKARFEVFPEASQRMDQYLEYIPLTWTIANNMDGAGFSPRLMYDMMIISLLGYQVDEYMETVVESKFADKLGDVEQLIHRLFDSVETIEGQNSNGGTELRDEDLSESFQTLKRYVLFVLAHPNTQPAHAYDKRYLASELKTYLLAHVHQAMDNQSLAKQISASNSLNLETLSKPRTSLLRWVRGDSAEHTGCFYCFAFFTCLLNLGTPKKKTGLVFGGAMGTYIAQDLCMSLATTCRMYNDFGSLKRDIESNNLNCLNFPEFHRSEGGEANQKALKEELLRLASYEDRKLDVSLRALHEVLVPEGRERVVDAVRFFRNVTDTYGQIYVLRDITVG